MLLGAPEIFNTIVDFIKEIVKVVSYEYLLYGGVGLCLLVILITFIRTKNTYEVKMLKAVGKFNKYFAKNPYINEDNLIAVNEMFKRVPKSFRSAWQQFMLNRDKLPSDYVNTVTCLDQPLKASAHRNATSVCGIFIGIVAGLCTFVGLAINFVYPGTIFEGLFKIALVPTIVLLLGYLFIAFLRARHTAITFDIYREFHELESSLNKACTTMPAYIDYEVLFTRKEIKEGIPALQEYLEKRALQEQRDKEQAELNNVPLENFNFDALGIENALLLERAMAESEKFFNVKRSLSEKIATKENEIVNYQKNFDEVTKEYERKSQAVKESLKQLNEQLNATSVNIEQNYIKKRYKEDQQKLQQLEKDYEIASIRFNKQQEDMQAEIDTYKAEIEARKKDLEEAMDNEGRSYANKIYGQVNEAVTEQNQPVIDEQTKKVNELTESTQKLQTELNDKQIECNDAQTRLETVTIELQTKLAEVEAVKNLKEYLTSPEFKDRVVEGKKAAKNGAAGIAMFEQNEINEQAKKAEAELLDAKQKQQELERRDAELTEKLRVLESNQEQLKQENEELEKSRTALLKKQSVTPKEVPVQKGPSKLDELNEEIANESKKLNANKSALNTSLKNASTSSKRRSLTDLATDMSKIKKSSKK